MNIENDPTEKIRIPDPGYHSDPGYIESNYGPEDDDKSFTEKLGEVITDDLPFVVFMAVMGIVLILVVVGIGSSGGGAATENVKACASIENPEAAKACFTAITKD